jgi:hypothetical protein
MLKRIRRWLYNAIRKFVVVGSHHATYHATTEFLSGALRGVCPGCRQSLEDHRYTLLGITIRDAATQARTRDLTDAYRKQAWETMASYAEFDGGSDALAVIALGCPRGVNTVLLLRDPAELYEAHEILEWQRVDNDSWAGVAEVVGDREWHWFGDSRYQELPN